MASSRQLRRSRKSSPIGNLMHTNVSLKNEVRAASANGLLLDDWNEPPLRTPAPSFEDHKGLERHGVLEHMAPLGSLPGQKVKSRLKLHQPQRRIANLKNGEARVARDDANTPEPILTRRPEPRKGDERLPKTSASRERDDDYDYIPKGVVKTTPAKFTSTQATLPHRTSNAHATAKQVRLESVVDSAIQRSHDLGDPVLGLAVKRLYEESLQDQVLANLLDAVLSQKPTPQQAAEFQGYVKAARKHIKTGECQSKLPKSPSSKSTAKSARTSVTRHLGTTNPSNAPGPNHHHPTSFHHQSPKQRAYAMEVNGSSPKQERPSKRIKRSTSASSGSSLSSLDSAVEGFVPTIETTISSTADRGSTQSRGKSKAHALLGPRLGSFSTSRHIDPSTRKPMIITNHHSTPNPQDLDFDAKREQLKKKFHDVLVPESGIRPSPTPPIQTQSIPPITVLSERTQQSRLRNSTVQKSKRDDHESLDSPVSSTYGDLLVPPPPGASRADTPNQLSRPPKAAKRAARIKMSPLKRRNGVTAGIGRAANTENSAVGTLRTDENEDHNNCDQCTSCSGEGKLLCCDGCWRVFHFTCLDPPMDSTEPPPGEWFCYKCMETRAPLPKPPRGVFCELMGDLQRKNPVAFHLPHPVREFFEGVKTGDEGEYEEPSIFKAQKARAGYEEITNNFKLKDAKDNVVLCFRCHKSSIGQHEMIPCDYCNSSWHLDCIDPPLAAPPIRRSGNRPRVNWKCPNHIDSELSNVVRSANARISSQAQPKTNRHYKIRRPKDAKVLDIGLRRGFKNNGLIEIENEDTSGDEDDIEREVSGIVYRVPETGLKLDFIDRVRQSNLEASQASPNKAYVRQVNAQKSSAGSTKAQQATFDKRPFSERQAALNLAQIAQSDPIISSSNIEKLIGALVAEAPIEVVAAADATALVVSEQEKRDLVALRALIDSRLQGGATI